MDFWDGDNLVGYPWAFDGDLFSPDSYENGIVGKVTIATEANTRAFEEVAALRTVHRVRPGPGSIPGPTGGPAALFNGTLAMWMDALGPRALMPHLSPSILNYEWGFAPFPYDRGADRSRVVSWGGSMAAITADSKHPDEAWEFLKFLSRRSSLGVLPDLVRPRMANWFDVYLDAWMPYNISALTEEQVRQQPRY